MSARCIVCERSAKWALALRQPLQRAGIRVYETRWLDDCWREVVGSRGSIVGVEATAANLESLVPWLQRFGRAFPRSRVVALAHRELAAYQWLLREAGAAHVAFSPRTWQPVARIVRRHLDAAPPAEDSERQRIWGRLPWSEESPFDSSAS